MMIIIFSILKKIDIRVLSSIPEIKVKRFRGFLF